MSNVLVTRHARLHTATTKDVGLYARLGLGLDVARTHFVTDFSVQLGSRNQDVLGAFETMPTINLIGHTWQSENAYNPGRHQTVCSPGEALDMYRRFVESQRLVVDMLTNDPTSVGNPSKLIAVRDQSINAANMAAKAAMRNAMVLALSGAEVLAPAEADINILPAAV